MNRLDKVVVSSSAAGAVEEILEIELGMVQQRVLDTGRGQFFVPSDAGGERFLLQEGTDFKYGARHLKRAIEKYVVYRWQTCCDEQFVSATCSSSIGTVRP